MSNSPFTPLAQAQHGLDEVDVAIILDGLLNPAVDPAQTRARLAELAESVSSYPKVWDGLAAAGFTGNKADYANRFNSSLSWVLEHRTGIPISLAVVLITCARITHAEAHGLNQPGHFLVHVAVQGAGSVVDPFFMREVEDQDGLSSAPIAAPKDLALRMLNNIKYGYAQQGQFHLALDFVDHQLDILPKSAELRLEAATFWERLGSSSSALEIYAQLLAEGANGSVQEQVLEQARNRSRALQHRKPQDLH